MDNEKQENSFEFGEELEIQIIKNSLSSRQFLISVIDYLQPQYFRNYTARVYCQIIKDHFKKYSDVPTFGIMRNEAKEILTPRDDLDLFEKNAKIIEECEVKNEDYLKNKVIEFCRIQAVIIAVKQSPRLIEEKKFDDLLENLRKAVSITENTDIGLDYFDNIKERLVDELRYKKHIKSGFTILDKITRGGWSVEDTPLVILVAPTGVGKSLMLIKFASVAVLASKKVLYITHELSSQRAAGRFDSIFTRVSQSERLAKHEDIEKRLQVIKNFCGKNLIIKEFHTKTCSTNMIAAYLNKLKNTGFIPDIIFNDYLDIMLTNGKVSSDDSYTAQKMVSEELRALAQETCCPIITASQTNRVGSDKEVIKNTDVAESFGKIFAADMVLSINQNDKDKLVGKCKLFVAKFRNGVSGITIPLNIDYQFMDASDVTKENEPEAQEHKQ